MTRLDLVIADAEVIDGGRDATITSADIGITNGRIEEIGDLSSRQRQRTIDGRGRVVAPGFIDSHTHVEMASLTGHPDRFAPINQGVTTTMIGADGFGWVGLGGDTERRWWEDMAAIYGPVPPSLRRWNTPRDFLEELGAASPTSVVPLAPHGNIRAAVMGAEPGRADREQMKAMRQLAGAWMDAGAVGLATGLDYFPGRHAETDEIIELTESIAERGGVYASHLRLSDLGRPDAWREAAGIARRSGAPLRIAHEKLDVEGSQLLDEIAVDLDVTLDSYLYPAGCTSLAFHVPAAGLNHGVLALSNRIATDDAFAARLATHMESKLTGNPGQQAIIAATTTGRFEGMTLSALAADRGTSVGQVAVELLRDEMPCALLVYVWQHSDNTWDETVVRTLADPRTVIATDGVYLGSRAHPRGFGTFPRVLGTFVRAQGLTTLPTAIHKMTGMVAKAYGLEDRGRIEPGLRADLVMFDPACIDAPANWEQPRRKPMGIDLVLVGGHIAKEESNAP